MGPGTEPVSFHCPVLWPVNPGLLSSRAVLFCLLPQLLSSFRSQLPATAMQKQEGKLNGVNEWSPRKRLFQEAFTVSSLPASNQSSWGRETEAVIAGGRAGCWQPPAGPSSLTTASDALYIRLLEPLLSPHVSCSAVSCSATPWTVALQAPLSMGFSRQKY